jgi:hypothetical protein
MAAVDLHLPLAYTPESNLALPEPPPDPELQPDLKECSVRGCHQKVPISAHTKMCEGCRGRHRVYATTKRMKRKQEKAALQNIVGNFVNQSGTGQGTDGSTELGKEEAAQGLSAGQGPQSVKVIVIIRSTVSLSDKGWKGTPAVAEPNIGVARGAFGHGYPPSDWGSGPVSFNTLRAIVF